MTESLTTPVQVDTPYGPVTATHQSWGHTHEVGGRGVRSFRVLGVMDGTRFRAFPGTEEGITIGGDDLAALLAPNPQGKPANVFRNTDVIAKHKEIIARPPAK